MEWTLLIIIAELKGLISLNISLKLGEISKHLFSEGLQTFFVEISGKLYFFNTLPLCVM